MCRRHFRDSRHEADDEQFIDEEGDAWDAPQLGDNELLGLDDEHKLGEDFARRAGWAGKDEDDAGRLPTPAEKDDPSKHPDFGRLGD